jgi:hypothetical protein
MTRKLGICTAVALCAILTGCATQRTTTVAPIGGDQAERVAQLELQRLDRKTQRWLQRKTMCRQLGVRFDRSGLCW